MLNTLKNVFASFESHDVRYVVIGGVAAVLYGVPRATFDLDILIEVSPGNARRLLEALTEAGMGTAGLTTPEEILANAITVFQDRVRIDVQTRTPGVTFEDAWRRRNTMDYQGQSLHWRRKSKARGRGRARRHRVCLPAGRGNIGQQDWRLRLIE